MLFSQKNIKLPLINSLYDLKIYILKKIQTQNVIF